MSRSSVKEAVIATCRELLSSLLQVEDLDAAGIEVADQVHSAEPIKT